MRSRLRRRYGRSDSSRWSANTRKWWSRAERVAPREVREYRAAKGTLKARRALEKLKEAVR